MSDPSLSEAIQEAYASAPAAEIVFHTLEFRHPEWGAPIRVVRGRDNLDATLEADAPLNPGELVTFTGFAFDLDLPEQGDSASPEISITIDNAGLEIEDALNLAILSTDPVQVTYRAYLESDTSAPSNNPPLTFTVARVPASQTQIQATAILGDFGNRRFPFEQYTATRFPGLVR
jgi:hypothetical protein